MSSTSTSSEEQIATLSKIRSDDNSLISIYSPPSRPIADLITQLENEYSIASSIKSDITRRNIQYTLTLIINIIKIFDNRMPKNGIVLFGHFGDTDILLQFIALSKPVNISLYRCDNHFYMDPLKELIV